MHSSHVSGPSCLSSRTGEESKSLTIHCPSLYLVPSVISIDLELEILFGIGNFSDLILFIDEVPATCALDLTGKIRTHLAVPYPSFSKSAGKTGS